MVNFFTELKRRHIYRVGAAYAVVAWLLLQLVNNLTPFMRLPDWAGGFFLVLLVVGFPIALVFAWILELRTSADHPLAPVTTGKLDWALIGALVVVIGLVSYGQFSSSQPTAASQPSVEAAREAAVKSVGISVAVLPFVNLSSDKEQEFFSDGMTEEITSALAKVPDLRVVGRTSAFQFKGQNQDLRAIGQSLNATHLIEGSVRKAGDRVRITVQLIKADDGTHIWAEDYDRQLTDIFAIQEDIARAITASLRMPLGLKPGENLVNNRSIDPNSYQQFLRTRMANQNGNPSSAAEVLARLEQIVAGNPDYAPAWARLALYYRSPNVVFLALRGARPGESRHIVDALFSKAEAAAMRAIQLDPNLAAGYLVRGAVMFGRGNVLMSDEMMQKAFALDPNDPDTLNLFSFVLAAAGQLKEANAMRQQLRALEPFAPAYSRFTAFYLWVDGQNDAATAILEAQPPDLLSRSANIAMIYSSMGRYAEAADMLEKLPPGDQTAPAPFAKDAARLLRTAPSITTAPQNLPNLGPLDWVYLHVGATDRALENRERDVAIGNPNPITLPFVWHSSWAPVRKTERFKAYVRSRGFVDYWRAKGWPQFCHPTTGNDFACE